MPTGIYKHKFGKEAHNYIDGRKTKKYYCIDCKKEITYMTWKYGLKRCRSCCQLGELNHSYIDGKSKFPYPLEWTETLKESIRQRDNYQCQLCAMTQEEHFIMYGRDIEIHHIDYDKQNCEGNNLVTTCKQCNMRANYNRDYWFAYFTYIMENK